LTIPAGGTGSTSSVTEPSGAGTGGEVYAVKSGDTLSRIAKHFGTTVKAIEAANPGVDPNHIKVNQKLTIPAKAEAAAPAASAPAPEPAPVMPAPVAPVTPPSTTPAK